MGSGEGLNDKTIVRYNIFQNNAHHAIRFSGETTNTTIHKNVFYCGPEISNQYIVWHKDWRGYTDNSFYYNNIFYNLGEITTTIWKRAPIMFSTTTSFLTSRQKVNRNIPARSG